MLRLTNKFYQSGQPVIVWEGLKPTSAKFRIQYLSPYAKCLCNNEVLPSLLSWLVQGGPMIDISFQSCQFWINELEPGKGQTQPDPVAYPSTQGHKAAQAVSYLCHRTSNCHFQSKHSIAFVLKSKGSWVSFEKKNKRKNANIFPLTVLSAFGLQENCPREKYFFSWKDRKT